MWLYRDNDAIIDGYAGGAMKNITVKKLVTCELSQHTATVIGYDTEALADGVKRMSSNRRVASFNEASDLMTHQPGSI